MFENLTTEALEKIALDIRDLSTNIGEVAPSCTGDQTIASAIQNRFPVVERLLRTAASREMRQRAQENLINIHKETIDEESKWVLEVPPTIYTIEPTSTENECCWVPFDFDKCAGKVPLNLLCLKSCDDIMDILVGNVAKFGRNDAVPGVVAAGETLNEAKIRIARWSMAFFTAYNILLGLDSTYTATLKPFHGLLATLENPAVPHIDGTNALEAFDMLACRLAIVGGNQWFACHPLIYDALDALVYPDERGNLPAHWSRRNGRLEFLGKPFVTGQEMPIDVQAGTGEVWVIDDATVGAFMGTDLAPAMNSDFVRTKGEDYGDASKGCGNECMFLYNFGTTFAKDANKVAVITDIPVQAGCVDAIADLANLVAPTTLIPKA